MSSSSEKAINAEQTLGAAFRVQFDCDAARAAELSARTGMTVQFVEAWFKGRQAAQKEAERLAALRPKDHEEKKVAKRINLTQFQISILVAAFEKDQLPDFDQRLKLSKQLNMTPRCIQVWFQNRRQRSKYKPEGATLHSRSSQWQLTPWQFGGHRAPTVPLGGPLQPTQYPQMRMQPQPHMQPRVGQPGPPMPMMMRPPAVPMAMRQLPPSASLPLARVVPELEASELEDEGGEEEEELEFVEEGEEGYVADDREVSQPESPGVSTVVPEQSERPEQPESPAPELPDYSPVEQPESPGRPPMIAQPESPAVEQPESPALQRPALLPPVAPAMVMQVPPSSLTVVSAPTGAGSASGRSAKDPKTNWKPMKFFDERGIILQPKLKQQPPKPPKLALPEAKFKAPKELKAPKEVKPKAPKEPKESKEPKALKLKYQRVTIKPPTQRVPKRGEEVDPAVPPADIEADSGATQESSDNVERNATVEPAAADPEQQDAEKSMPLKKRMKTAHAALSLDISDGTSKDDELKHLLESTSQKK